MPPCGETTRGRVKFQVLLRRGGKSKAAVALTTAPIVTVTALAAITTVSALATLAARAPAATAASVVASATTAATVASASAATVAASSATATAVAATTTAGRTTTAASATATTGSAAVLCLANAQTPASEIGPVELCDRCLSHLTAGEGYKGEAALTTSLPVKWHV